MIDAYLLGLKSAFKAKKMITLIYLSTLIFGLLLAIPFFSFATSSFTDTRLINNLLKGFDFTAYYDITNNYEEAIDIFINLIKWFGIGYFFFSIFLSGGIISFFTKANSEFKVKSFLSECGNYFGKFFRITLYTLIIQILVFAVLAIPFAILISELFDKVQSEATLVYVSIVFLLFYLAFFSFFMVVADYTKIRLVLKPSNKVIKTLWTSIVFVFKNFKAYLLYLITFLFPILISIIYLFIEANIGMTSLLTIILMIILQQIFIWGRILGKIWILASATIFFESKTIIENDIVETAEIESSLLENIQEV